MGVLGAVLGQKYRVIRLIGEGGMGTVYEAEHVLIDRHVAVKTLRPEFAHNPEVVRRFHREAQAASRIGHVNIIDVMDMGVAENGSPYIVMELLDGESLSRVLERDGTLPVERAADVVGQVLGALSAAHEKGIIHRDLKPENIFLINHGGRPDFVKLLDFGISKFQSMVGDQRLTSSGVALGTPYYMAPEQAAGCTDLDHRVDIYAMGAVLYELLAGRPPYQGSNYNALLAQIVTTDPPALHTVRPDIDPALERVVQTAMARNPEQRFRSAAELLEALVPFGAGRTPFERAVIGRPSVEDERRRAAHLPTLPTPAALRLATPRPASARSAAVAATLPAESLDLTPSGSATQQAAVAVRGTRRRAGAAIAFVALAIVGAAYFTWGGAGSHGRSRTTDAAAPTVTTDRPARAADSPAVRPTIPAATTPGPPGLGTTVPAAEPPTVLSPAAVPAATAVDADAGEADRARPDAGGADTAPVEPRDAGPTRRDAARREPDASGPAAAEAGLAPGGADGLLTVQGHTVRTNYEEP